MVDRIVRQLAQANENLAGNVVGKEYEHMRNWSAHALVLLLI